MSHNLSDFIPDRERAADAGATIPVIDISPFAGDDESGAGAVTAGAHWRGKILAARQITAPVS